MAGNIIVDEVTTDTCGKKVDGDRWTKMARHCKPSVSSLVGRSKRF